MPKFNRSRDRNKNHQGSSFLSAPNLSVKEKIRRVVTENTNRPGRIFDICIQILIIFSLIVYSIGTLPDLTETSVWWLNTLDLFCYVVFTIEYVLRIYVAKRPFKYIFSFYGVIDLIAILPFIFGRQFDLRAIRALRVFRIIKALQISRYNESIKRFLVALRIIKPELVLFSVLSSVFIFISAAGIYYFEREAQPEEFASIFHSLWWAVITLTTVGYGDVYPITVGGRIFTFVILMIGLGVITIPTGLIASALSTARDLELKDDKNISEAEKAYGEEE